MTLRLSAPRFVAQRIAPLIALTSSIAGSGSSSRTTRFASLPRRTNATFARTLASPTHELGIALTIREYAGSVEHDDLHRQSEPLLDYALDLRLEFRRVALAALEEHVSARDVGRDVLQPERLHARLEIGHLDQRLPPDVDPSQ
jgi:hypothetical protein